ncbi:MAG: phytanoyl-CoA dioxygenase family protein [Pseudomonadales bacterium]
MALQTLQPDCPPEAILAAMERDGACIVAGLAPAPTVRQMVAEVTPFIERTPYGSDDFTGRRTQRTGALVARAPTCRDLVLNPKVLDAARTFLKPWAERILLHLTQTIYIHPGQGAQVLHRDRLAWGTHLPLSIEPQFNTIWALTDFTVANGATRVVPGSHTWPWERKATADQVVQAEMSAGSVLLYSGTVLHSGGRNDSDVSRLGLNITYCLGWLRQEENQYLSCPPHIARTLDPELQELLGYTQGNYALGYYSDPEATEAGRDILPPEFALGRKPRAGQGFSMSEATDEGVSLEQMKDKVPLGEDV